MSENDEKKDRSREEGENRSDEQGTPVRNRITEGPRRKGGKNKPPQKPRPNVRPKPQKPSSSSQDADPEANGDE